MECDLLLVVNFLIVELFKKCTPAQEVKKWNVK
jgi:hypothetical protein